VPIHEQTRSLHRDPVLAGSELGIGGSGSGSSLSKH
jgi:hypothetical protein